MAIPLPWPSSLRSCDNIDGNKVVLATTMFSLDKMVAMRYGGLDSEILWLSKRWSHAIPFILGWLRGPEKLSSAVRFNHSGWASVPMHERIAPYAYVRGRDKTIVFLREWRQHFVMTTKQRGRGSRVQKCNKIRTDDFTLFSYCPWRYSYKLTSDGKSPHDWGKKPLIFQLSQLKYSRMALLTSGKNIWGVGIYIHTPWKKWYKTPSMYGRGSYSNLAIIRDQYMKSVAPTRHLLAYTYVT